MRTSTHNALEVWLESRARVSPIPLGSPGEPSDTSISVPDLGGLSKEGEWIVVSERSPRVVAGVGGKISLFGGFAQVTPNSTYRLAIKQSQNSDWEGDLKVEVADSSGVIYREYLLAGDNDVRYLDLAGWMPCTHVHQVQPMTTEESIDEGCLAAIVAAETNKGFAIDAVLDKGDNKAMQTGAEVLASSVDLPPTQADVQLPAPEITSPPRPKDTEPILEKIAPEATTPPGLALEAAAAPTSHTGRQEGIPASTAAHSATVQGQTDVSISADEFKRLAIIAKELGQEDNADGLVAQPSCAEQSITEQGCFPLIELCPPAQKHPVCSLHCTLEHGSSAPAPLLIQQLREGAGPCSLRLSVYRGQHCAIPVHASSDPRPALFTMNETSLSEPLLPADSQCTLMYQGASNLDFGPRDSAATDLTVTEWTPKLEEDTPWCMFQYSCGEASGPHPDPATGPLILTEEDRQNLLASLNDEIDRVRVQAEKEEKQARKAARRRVKDDREIQQRNVDRQKAEEVKAEEERLRLKEKRRQAGLKGHQTKLDRGIVQPAKRSQITAKPYQPGRKRQYDLSQVKTTVVEFKADHDGRWPDTASKTCTFTSTGDKDQLPSVQLGRRIETPRITHPRQKSAGRSTGEDEIDAFPDDAYLVPETDDGLAHAGKRAEERVKPRVISQSRKDQEVGRFHLQHVRHDPKPYVLPSMKPYFPRHHPEDRTAPNISARGARREDYRPNYTLPRMSGGAALYYPQHPIRHAMRRTDTPRDYGLAMHGLRPVPRPLRLREEEEDLRPIQIQQREYEERDRLRGIKREKEDRKEAVRVAREADLDPDTNKGKVNGGSWRQGQYGKTRDAVKVEKRGEDYKRKYDDEWRSPLPDRDRKRQRQTLDYGRRDVHRHSQVKDCRADQKKEVRAGHGETHRFAEQSRARTKVTVVIDMTHSDSE